MRKSDRVYLQLMLDAAEQCIEFLGKYSFNKFSKNRLLQSAVIMQFIVLGELAGKLSAKTKAQIPLRWPDIVGLRNKAVHEYFYLELAIIYTTVRQDLPTVKQALHTYLRKRKADF